MKDIAEILKQDNDNYQIQERLAETYLPSSPKGAKASEDSSNNTKAISHLPKTRNRSALKITTFSTSTLLLCAVLFYIFSANPLKTHSPYENLLLTQKVNLFGAAGNERGYFSLINDGTEKRTGLIIDLKEPLDLTSKYLLISILAKEGRERLRVIFRDKNYRSYISNMLEVKDTKKEWQNFIVSANKSKESIDARNIQHIRLELENSPLPNKMGSIIHIRKVALIDN